MNRGSTIFLRGVIGLIGLFVLALCVFVLPQLIATDRVGYYRPIIIGLYVPAVPFFVALYEAWQLLDNIDRKQAFSLLSVRALRYIKFAALSISALFALGMPYIFYAADRDDAPGVLLIALIIAFASFVIATAAAVFQSLVQTAVDIKTENDLTV